MSRLFAAATLIFLSSCATTRSGKCSSEPICLTSLDCTTNREAGCRECQCSPAHQDWRNQPANQPPTQQP